MDILLTERQKALLRSVARKKDDLLFGRPNHALNEVIEQLKEENPRAFLRDSDLKHRTFYHKPANLVAWYDYETYIDEHLPVEPRNKR